jgi:hypothetical protein
VESKVNLGWLDLSAEQKKCVSVNWLEGPELTASMHEKKVLDGSVKVSNTYRSGD